MSTITQTVTALPAAPDPATDSPDSFSLKAAAMVLAQKGMVVELETFRGQVNTVKGEMVTEAASTAADAIATAADRVQTGIDVAAASASVASAAASAATAASYAGMFTGTSTTSLAVGTGSKTLTTQTGKQYVTGAFVTFSSSASPANYMYGTVTSYNSGTGVLVINSTLVAGSGTFASWDISLSGAPGATGTGITPAAVGFFATGGTTPKTLTMDVDLTASSVVNNTVPAGLISMWYGLVAAIPSGWALCDGSSGTPDLRGKFVVGASADSGGAAKTNITGSLTQTGGNKDAIVVAHSHGGGTGSANPAHSHGVTDPGHVHSVTGTTLGITAPAAGSSLYMVAGSNTTNAAATGLTVSTENISHSHTIAVDGATGSNANLPPYYALCYIMKT